MALKVTMHSVVCYDGPRDAFLSPSYMTRSWDVNVHVEDFSGSRCYEEVRSLGNAEATFNLGVLYQEQGDIKKATQLYEEARSLGNVAATFNLVVLYEKQGDIKKAMELYEEARSLGDADATFNLGVLHKKQGDMKEAMGL